MSLPSRPSHPLPFDRGSWHRPDIRESMSKTIVWVAKAAYITNMHLSALDAVVSAALILLESLFKLSA